MTCGVSCGQPGRRLADKAERTAERTIGWAAAWAVWIRAHLPRPLRWLTARPQRLVTLAWLVGLALAGHARLAAADTFITGPDLSGGGPKTLFETFDFTAYTFTVKPDDSAGGFLGLGTAFYGIVGILTDVFGWISLGLLSGALVLLEWFLNLTLYRDSADQIDAATRMVATHVFWPLISATIAIGAVLTYARWRGDGRGFVSDLGWVVAAAVLGIGFASGPSTIMTTVDSVRTDMADGIIAGSADFVAPNDDPTGFPTPSLTGDPHTRASRQLVNDVWNLYAAYFWCHGEFGPGSDGIAICRQAGYHALANDATWQSWMQALDNQQTPPVFGQEGAWIRGQDLRRLGIVLTLSLITIPTALLLLRLVFAGLKAVVGLLLMLIVGVLFLAWWPIPGWFRHTGVRYWIFTLGLEAQGLFVTLLVSAEMVIVTIVGTQVGKYGYFVVAALVAIGSLAAVQAHAWLEALTTGGGARSMGIAGVLIARSLAGMVGGLVGGGAGLVASGARALIPSRGGGMSGQAARNWASLKGPAYWMRRSRMSTVEGEPTAVVRRTAFRGDHGRPALSGRASAGPAVPGRHPLPLASSESTTSAVQERQAAAAQQRTAERAAARERRDTEQLHARIAEANRTALVERGQPRRAWERSRYRQTLPRPTDIDPGRVWIASHARRWVVTPEGNVWGIATSSSLSTLDPRSSPRSSRPYRSGGTSQEGEQP